MAARQRQQAKRKRAAPRQAGGKRASQAAPGRPKSAEAHRAILKAALQMVLAGESLSGLSLEAVAKRAGVGKATIYRHWPTKEALLLEAFITEFKSPLPALAGTSVRDDLSALLGGLIERDPAVAQRVFLAMMSDGLHFSQLNRQYRAAVVEPWVDAIRGVLRRGVSSGELAPGTDVEQTLTLLMAPVQVHLLVKGGRDPLPPNYPRFVVETVLQGVASAKA
ncbi:MAG TPA: TetR/AcrR family transcriptional regulator [bacterium]